MKLSSLSLSKTMKKEIKFRVWDKIRKKMRLLENTELMQFTGLRDKLGKEIYEGDIVLIEPYLGWKKEYRVVQWDNKMMGFNAGIGRSLIGDIEIVGNVYENS